LGALNKAQIKANRGCPRATPTLHSPIYFS
jgi:hypothetical protein